MKITFMGAGSTVFAKNVLGDIMLTPALHECDIALYDIDPVRLEESYLMVTALNRNINGNRATVKKYLDVDERKDALRGADFVVNAIQVGFYDPCTIIDFEVPKKYGLRQTIADSNGIGGIFRALRTIPVLKDFTDDMQEVCPNAYFLNYTNPMAQLAGWLGRYSGIKSVGLCHSVQGCSRGLLKRLDIEYSKPIRERIAGINHMGWLLEIEDADGTDLYPEIRRRAKEKNAAGKHHDMVRYDYIDKFGYYCTESSEHNAEYSALYIKPGREDLIGKFNIPLDEYPRRCIDQIAGWKKQKEEIQKELEPDTLTMHDQIAVVAAVGRKMAFRPGISGKIFATLGEAGVNIRMINQGPDELNIIFGVDNKDFKTAIHVLYDSFVK